MIKYMRNNFSINRAENYWLIKCSVIIMLLSVSSCSGTFERIPEDQFVGTWELKGRSIYEGVRINIAFEKEKLVGKVEQLNDNKFVKMYMEAGQTWVPVIERTSIYQFRLTEYKMARELFALYDLSTAQEYSVEFLDENTFALAAGDANPQNSRIKYVRVME